MQAKSHYFGDKHRGWLSQHRCFRFNTAHAPSKNAQRVNHGGVRIGAHHGIGIRLNFVARRHGTNHAREILQIYLVANSGVWRDHFEIVECSLAPAQECITLHVALKFQFGVQTESIDVAKTINLHGMVDDQFRREKRIDPLGISAHALYRFAHGGEIDDGWHAGEIL